MKTVAAVAGLWLVSAGTAFAGPDDVLGRFLLKETQSEVEISRCGASVCGRIAAGPDIETKTDRRNPDPALRTRPILGLQLLGGFTRTDTGWTGGTIYDPKVGRTYDAELTPRADGGVDMRGCYRGTVLCRTQVWPRVR